MPGWISKARMCLSRAARSPAASWRACVPILLEKPNLLFLDEPTNHLDIYTREHLGEALRAYEGTLCFYVTHDRYLMNSLGCPVLYLEDGTATLYADYDAMMRRDTSMPVQKKEEKAKTCVGQRAAAQKSAAAPGNQSRGG